VLQANSPGVLVPFDCEATRAAYLAHFGPLFDAWTSNADADGPDFWMLCFWNPVQQGGHVVFASFGAPAGDFFLVAVAPSGLLADAVEQSARAACALPGMQPPTVLDVRGKRTPFVGIITLPDEEGSFVVPVADGATRPVRRIVPVTLREHARAKLKGPQCVLRELRAAGALVADVLRDCTIAPDDSRWYREVCAPANVRGARRQQERITREFDVLRDQYGNGAAPPAAWPMPDRDRAMVERQARLLDAALAHYEARLPPVLTDAEELELMAASIGPERFALALKIFVTRGMDHIVEPLWDDWTLERFAEILVLVIVTHPYSRPLLDAVMVGREELPDPVSRSRDTQVATLRSLLSDAAELIASRHQGHTAHNLLKLGIDACVNRSPADDPKDEDLSAVEIGWPIAIRAMQEAVLPCPSKRERGIDSALKIVLSMSNRLAQGNEGDTPLERLAILSENVAFFLTFGFALGMKHPPVDARRMTLH
jgi:hypothetical protein